MKTRDKFWLNKMLWLIAISMLFVLISIYNLIQFNGSYIIEEEYELNTFQKQILWAIKPLLKNNDVENLRLYCSEFKNNKELSFRIFDKDKNYIAGSFDEESKEIAKNDSRINKKAPNIWKLYKRSFKDKKLEKTEKFEIDGNKYFLELSISEEFVINSIIKGQKNIIIFFITCLLILILNLIYIFNNIRNSFNTFEDSVKKISEGNLDAEINIPKIELLEELSVAVSKMTQKLKNQILRLTKLEQYKSDFIQNVSHEIKTPITAINSAVELIEENCKISPLDKECFDIIKFQTLSINKLAQDILSLAETDLEKTKDDKSFKIFCLNDAIKKAIDFQDTLNLKINFNNKQEIHINGNEELFITAISNILSNAIKYSNSETIDVNISQSDKIEIEIIDYGIGIGKEHLEHIFEKFYRVDKARSRQKDGSGLGLSIVKNIIELHNWAIEVKSEINKGTSFKIIIS
ncbi:hypothetical protein IJ182_00970 [bacterium]|nr:hypothetical protein [bacterium]